MPGDPRECRQHAMRCLQLAAEARNDSIKEHFLSLAATWQGLAKQLEKARDLLEIDDDPPDFGRR